jgi:hypothetical protein
MKKLVLASVMAMASLSLVTPPTLRAQADISIKDPTEYNAYNTASTQSDPKLKASGLESFLTAYPQSVVKTIVLNTLVDTYWGLQDMDHTLSACTRLLQVDPNNLKVILYSVIIKKTQGGGATVDTQALDDAAALAQKGLTVPKPADTAADDWKKLTATAYPIFHSAIAMDDVLGKKDFKAAISEYRSELMIFPPEATTAPGMGLADTVQVAQTYGKQELIDAKSVRDADAAVKAAATDPTAKAAAQKTLDDAKAQDATDFIQATWFFARAWNFAPVTPKHDYKADIKQQLEYYYKKYHGVLDGLDAIKAQAASTLFPPDGFTISPAPTPEQKIHTILVGQSDLGGLALEDKEMVLSFGAKDDADKLWGVMKDKDTPVPGIVIDATANQIKVAVTADAKQNKTADFIVNMKDPIADKDIPKAGAEFKLLSEGGPELDGTYDNYAQVPATDTSSQTAQIVLKNGFIQTKKAPVHKPSPAHRPAASH